MVLCLIDLLLLLCIGFIILKLSLFGNVGIFVCVLLFLLIVYINFYWIFIRKPSDDIDNKAKKYFGGELSRLDKAYKSIRSRHNLIENYDGAVREAFDLMEDKVYSNIQKFKKYMSAYDYVNNPGIPAKVLNLVTECENVVKAYNDLLDEVIAVDNSAEEEYDMQKVYSLIDSMKEVQNEK